jgi:hypothetical protein
MRLFEQNILTVSYNKTKERVAPLLITREYFLVFPIRLYHNQIIVANNKSGSNRFSEDALLKIMIADSDPANQPDILGYPNIL